MTAVPKMERYAVSDSTTEGYCWECGYFRTALDNARCRDCRNKPVTEHAPSDWAPRDLHFLSGP